MVDQTFPVRWLTSICRALRRAVIIRRDWRSRNCKHRFQLTPHFSLSLFTAPFTRRFHTFVTLHSPSFVVAGDCTDHRSFEPRPSNAVCVGAGRIDSGGHRHAPPQLIPGVPQHPSKSSVACVWVVRYPQPRSLLVLCVATSLDRHCDGRRDCSEPHHRNTHAEGECESQVGWRFTPFNEWEQAREWVGPWHAATSEAIELTRFWDAE